MKKSKGNVVDFVIVFASIIYSFYLGIETRKVFGAILSLTGLVVWSIARHNLGEAFSVTPQAKFLVRTGVYKKIRHPIYFFSTIAVVGVCIMYNIWWMYVLMGILIILQYLRAKAEEKTLLNKFQNEYLEYKKSTWF